MIQRDAPLPHSPPRPRGPRSTLIIFESTLRFPQDLDSIVAGNGLRATASYRRDETVAEFIGEIVSRDEFFERSWRGEGDYGLGLPRNLEVLDCRANAIRGICLASQANDPGYHRGASVLLQEDGSTIPAESNSHVWIDPATKRIYLKAGKFREEFAIDEDDHPRHRVIRRGAEILFDYGDFYHHATTR